MERFRQLPSPDDDIDAVASKDSQGPRLMKGAIVGVSEGVVCLTYIGGEAREVSYIKIWNPTIDKSFSLLPLPRPWEGRRIVRYVFAFSVERMEFKIVAIEYRHKERGYDSPPLPPIILPPTVHVYRSSNGTWNQLSVVLDELVGVNYGVF